jgi:single-stranded-DNA-specific exonuclease
MEKAIKEFSDIFLERIKNKKVHVISHYDTDGITSAAIMLKTLEKLQKQFSVKIVKQLTKEEIDLFPKDRAIILLDLGSGSLEHLSKINQEIFIIDHHELGKDFLSSSINILNTHLLKNYEDLCSAELSYLVSRAISEENKCLAQLAVLGMVGDTMERDINKTRNKIINEANIRIKRGLLIYPSTRPLDKTLEYSSRPFIPGVTGNSKGTFELLKEIGIEKTGKTYKSLIDLNEEEMKKLVTTIMLRLNSDEKNSQFIGNLYLTKFFNKIEDARELSAIINACGRMDKSDTALLLCLGNINARKKAERIYFRYRQNIISGLKYIEENSKIQGREYVIINGRDKIKDSIVGTLASILSFSSVYKEGTIIIAMAYNEDKIKISTRIAGRNPRFQRNLKELMDYITSCLGGDSGGHKEAAGCVIRKEDENKFIELVKKRFEYETIRV